MERTPDHLLDTAERLYGSHGLDGVSLRMINAEAGMNPAAVHYHFGSRDALVEAILVRRMGPVMVRRAARLDALSTGATPSVHAIAEALVLPLAELLGEAGQAGRRYLAFLSRILDARSPALARVTRRHFRTGSERFESLLQQARPELPGNAVLIRLSLAVELTIRGLAQGIPVPALVDFIAGGFAAPHTEDSAP